MGGKVQAPPGYADHVRLPATRDAAASAAARSVCVEICSGQAITPRRRRAAPAFDREKCVHCGACLWNCASRLARRRESHATSSFRAGAGRPALGGELRP